MPACLPAWCACDVQFGVWACSDDCSGECVPPFGPAGPLSYLIIDLGTLGGDFSRARAINNLGQVVGWAECADGAHAFLWEHGTMTDLGGPYEDEHSYANDISESGHVVISSANRAYLWYNGTTQLIQGLGPSVTAHPYAVNSLGQVVGTSTVASGTSHAFLWHNGEIRDLTEEGFGSWAWDISNAGHVVGGSSLWQDGIVTDLGSLLGGGPAYGAGVNDLGQVVGSGHARPDDVDPFLIHAFLWENEVIRDIGVHSTLRHSEAVAINNLGQVVGLQRQNGGEYYGFLYDSEAGMRNLHDLIPMDGPWWYWLRIDPEDINDAGQIVGTAEFDGLYHAFLMTPIDADFDDDDDSDLYDFAAFQSCMTGPGAPVQAECRAYDINRNGRIDMDDLRVLQWVFTGQ